MPNDDYIKRSDALRTVEDYFREKEKSSSLFMAVETMCLCLIHKTPAADVVPAPVRCSDCRFYDKRDGGAPGGTGWCSRPGAGCGVPEEFFCAGAERKEADR